MNRPKARRRQLRHLLTRSRLRDAARLGVQSAAAAVATLILLGIIGIDLHFLGVLSAVLVLDPSRDATIGNALQRIVATLIGTVVGGASLLLAPQGQLVSMAIVMLVMGAIAVVRPQWRYGLVAAAGLAVGVDAALWEAARDRTVAIFVGAAAGISAGLLIWPKTSRGYAIDHLREALATCNELLKRTIAAAVEDSDVELSAQHGKFTRQIERAAAAANSMRLAQGREKRLLSEAIHRVERLWHALIILDRVGETKTGSSVVGSRQSRRIEQLKEQCCGALECLERLEPVPADLLEKIESGCAELTPTHGEESDPDRVERFGLAYGLHEVGRNIHELSEAIAQLQERLVDGGGS